MGGKTKVEKVKRWKALATLRAIQRKDRNEFRSGIQLLDEKIESLFESNRLGALAQMNHEHRIVSQKKCLNDLYGAIETLGGKLQAEVESGRKAALVAASQQTLIRKLTDKLQATTDDLYKTIEVWEEELRAKTEADRRAALEATGREWAINRIAKKLKSLTGNLDWRILKLETWAGKRPIDPETGAELEYPCPYCGSLEIGTGHVCEAKKTIVGLDSQPAKTTGFTNVIVHEKDEEQDYEKIIEENRYKEEEMSEHEDTEWLDGLLEMLAEPANREEMVERIEILALRGCSCSRDQKEGPDEERCHSCFAHETLRRIRHQYIRDMCHLPTDPANASFTAVMEAVDRLHHKFKHNLNLGKNAGQAVETIGLYRDGIHGPPSREPVQPEPAVRPSCPACGSETFLTLRQEGVRRCVVCGDEEALPPEKKEGEVE